MNLKHISIFNLIEIFRGKRTNSNISVSRKTHCSQKFIHDYYCDAEKPFISESIIGYN